MDSDSLVDNSRPTAPGPRRTSFLAAAAAVPAACNSCWAFDKTAAADSACGEFRDVRAAGGWARRTAALGCSWLKDIRTGGEFGWLEALLRGRGRSSTPAKDGKMLKLRNLWNSSGFTLTGMWFVADFGGGAIGDC